MDTSKLIYDWNIIDYEINRNPANHPHGVWFDDETLRDGLQSPSARNPTIDEKKELLTYMEKLGIQKVDLGLPGAGPFHREHINSMLSHIIDNDYQIRPGAAVRTLMHDIEPLVEMQEQHGIQIQASAFLGTSPIRQYTEGWTMEKLISTMEKAVSYAVENDVPVMFVTEDTTRSNPDDVRAIYQRAMELGVRRLCVCDTCGHVTPNGVKKLLNFVDEEVIKDGGYKRNEIEVNWHGHQDRGLGVANNIAAVEAGADVIHGTALGVGERAGNAPLDQTLVNLKLMGVIDNDLTLLDEYMRKANKYIEVPLPRNYPVFGEDAFETGTGVHASAVIKAMRKGDDWLADRVYSGVPAGDFGLKQVIRIGHMAGRSNIIWWLEQNGYEVTDELVAHLFEVAKSQRRNMLDSEVESAVNQFLNQ
ncbi:MAG TPA: 2-isopropylmalate synthase [Candidatus Poseidoniaceae archaeon]|nr:LeuA family protein [Candidatus Thermoplasmatota archaeon]DAC53995.1 MAG TPA: 2-isopropylmalate synthase [Candidatus Poseidoniales archaeon]DAC61679.1 MAG TPA: 2-isopropylmalate synthase [Candidatus Poseidoniales archaeon]HII23192.1 2-isopropylmalate synthase [Candidatus Poseidoniaceae archaeon]HII49742.1 2-isopropylmalate synthase [Candidatus Poseidoniaceae archaeon]|tara:strand:+ start:1016 stop:2272 length:1257 start_codon:yes stop_codon:yes gene_type:complete